MDSRDEGVVNFACPATMRPHAAKVLAGEYAIPGLEPKTILDIGANVGAFAVWARRRWPEASIYCYEPDPENYALLLRNVNGDTRTTATNAAVYCEGILRLYKGRSNCGEASLWKHRGTTDESVDVEGIHPMALPVVDFVKLDTEGSEIPILLGLQGIAKTQAIAVEWHAEDHGWMIRKWLMFKGFQIISDTTTSQHRGVLKARRQ